MKKLVGKKTLLGFTLIELLVVIAIIGVLAAMATTAYGDSQRKARDNRRKADLQAIKKALALYKADSPGGYSYPTCQTYNTDIAQYTTSQLMSGTDQKSVWQSGCHFKSDQVFGMTNYLPNFPVDPNPNSVYTSYGYYTYTVDSSGNLTACPTQLNIASQCNNATAFRLVACLENLKDPQRDDIKPDGTYDTTGNLQLFCFPNSGINAFKTRSYSIYNE